MNAPLVISLAFAASVVGIAWAQSTSTSGPARPRSFSLPYKKDGKTVLLITGAEQKPLSLTLVQIQDFQLETYHPDGTPNLRGAAPECVLDLGSYQATSDGPLALTQVGGAFTLKGVGFVWDQKSERLRLSNRVEATFRLKPSAAPILTRP